MTAIEQVKRICRRLAVALLALLGVGCPVEDYPAEKFFEGRGLDAARAIEKNQAFRLPALVEGLDLDMVGKKSMTLLWFAILKQNFDAIETLVRLGAKPDEHIVEGLGSAVASALHHPDTRFLASMLDGGLSADHKTVHGRPLIMRAAGADGATLDHLKLLVERGADLDAKNRLGETALIAAIDTLQPDRAMYLVEKGADINTFNFHGASAMYAVQLTIDDLKEGSALRKEYEKLRDMMIARGAKYPPDDPAKVRRWMKSQGMKVIE